jgi:nicotinamidase-related amidase
MQQFKGRSSKVAAFNIEDTALILIDHQEGVLSWVNSIDQNDLKTSATNLAKFAKSQGMPVVITSSMEFAPHNGEIVSELRDAIPEAYEARIKRNGIINAWSEPAFVAAVAATGKKNLVLAGVLTDVCAAPVAIDAAADGFNVKVVVNACGSRSKLDDEAALGRIAAAGIPLMTSGGILSELVKDWTTPAGRSLQRIFAGA